MPTGTISSSPDTVGVAVVNYEVPVVETKDLTTTVPGPETAIFSEACRKNKVWGVFSITGEQNPKGAPFNSFLLVNDKGEIVLNYHKILPWVPMEPWYPGNETMVVEG